MNMKSLPVGERPMEKALENGFSSLSNAELIGILLKSGTKEKSAVTLANDVLAILDDGIRSFPTVTAEELAKLKGIGSKKACTLLAAVELGMRVQSADFRKRTQINSAKHCAEFLMDKLMHEKREHFLALLMDVKGGIISVETVSIGGLANASVHPREAFIKAIRRSAAAVIFAHNHPSGDPTPSKDDISTTRRLIEVGELLGIKVLDHIVIGDGKYVSMLSEGIV